MKNRVFGDDAGNAKRGRFETIRVRKNTGEACTRNDKRNSASGRKFIRNVIHLNRYSYQTIDGKGCWIARRIAIATTKRSDGEYIDASRRIDNAELHHDICIFRGG